jgi:hypothetical protein
VTALDSIPLPAFRADENAAIAINLSRRAYGAYGAHFPPEGLMAHKAIKAHTFFPEALARFCGPSLARTRCGRFAASGSACGEFLKQSRYPIFLVKEMQKRMSDFATLSV